MIASIDKEDNNKYSPWPCQSMWWRPRYPWWGSMRTISTKVIHIMTTTLATRVTRIASLYKESNNRYNPWTCQSMWWRPRYPWWGGGTMTTTIKASYIMTRTLATRSTRYAWPHLHIIAIRWKDMIINFTQCSMQFVIGSNQCCVASETVRRPPIFKNLFMIFLFQFYFMTQSRTKNCVARFTWKLKEKQLF
jgi:hypothetical protein